MEKNIAVVMSAVMATSTVTSIASSYVGAEDVQGKNDNALYPKSQFVVTLEEFKKVANNFNGENVVKDVNLRYMINSRYKNGSTEEQLRNNNVTKEMMENLVMLSPEQCMAHDPNEEGHLIKSLEGLEHAKNLTWLSLVNQKPESLDPIKNCTKINHLDIRNNAMYKDISALSNLKELVELDMHGVNVGNIEPLRECKKLKKLVAYGCGIKDLSPLKDLVDLEYLSLERNDFTDIKDLSNLTKLTYLDISKNNKMNYLTGKKTPTVKSINALENMKNLEFLSFTNNDIDNISVLRGMTKLKKLYANNNNIVDWKPIENLSLEVIYKDGNAASSEESKPSDAPSKEKSSYEVYEVINPKSMHADSRESGEKKLPTSVTIKVKTHDQNFKHKPGVYNNGTLRYIVKDTDGQLVNEPLKFSAFTTDDKHSKVEDSKAFGHYDIFAKDGYLDIVGRDIADFTNMKLELMGNSKYELVGTYYFQEGPCINGYFIKNVETNGDFINLREIKPVNKTTYDIPAEKDKLFVITVSKKQEPVTLPKPADTEKNEEQVVDVKPSVKKTSNRSKQVINYMVVDESGKLVKAPIKFLTKSSTNNPDVIAPTSKDGLVSFEMDGTDRKISIQIDDANYELVGDYSYEEEYPLKTGVSFAKSINKDGKNVKPGNLEGDTFKVEDKDLDVLKLVLRKKGSEPAPSLPSGEGEPAGTIEEKKEETTKTDEYVKANEVNFVVKDEHDNIVTKQLNFQFKDINDNNNPKISSQNGYVNFKAISYLDCEYDLSMEDDEYTLDGMYKVSESSSKKFGFVDRNNNRITIAYLKVGDNGKLIIPEDKKDVLVIRVKSKSNASIAVDSGSLSLSPLSMVASPVLDGLNKKQAANNAVAPVEGKTLENIPVKWKLNADRSDVKIGKLVYDGVLTLPDGVQNPHGISASITMNVPVKTEKEKSKDGSGVSVNPNGKTDKTKNNKDNSTILDNKDDKKNSSSLHKSKKTGEISSKVDNGGSSSASNNTRRSYISGNSGSPSTDNKEKHSVSTRVIVGHDRVRTSVELSRANYSTADSVILVNGYNYPDALVSSALSSQLKAPILLTNGKAIGRDVMDEITRLGAKNVIIVGGSGSMSNELEKSIDSKYNTERIAGSNRYETANKVFDKLSSSGNMGSTGIITSGENYPDALSAGTIAAANSNPILLVRKDSMSGSTRSRIDSSTLKNLVVVGGQSSVSSKIEESIAKKSIRLSGRDRYETSMKIAEYQYKRPSVVLVASGENYADALSAGGVLGKLKSPLVLTRKTKTPSYVKDYLKPVSNLMIVGGSQSVMTKQFD